jgi:hypothetical protein
VTRNAWIVVGLAALALGGYALYRAATAERIAGGLASGKSAAGVDPAELAAGIEVEMEHTGDRAVAREIALDHLVGEDPRYYTKLKAAGL